MIAAASRGVRTSAGAPAARTGGLWSIVLAAGSGSRYGGPKLLARRQDRSLLARAGAAAVALTGSRAVVVLGANASRLAVELEGLPITQVTHRRWRSGMSGSLAAGIRSLPRSARAALILLADQFAVGPDDLRLLAQAWSRRPDRPAAARFAGRLGAPAIFPRSWFPRLLGLRGDAGARALLREAAVDVTAVDMPAAGLDLDHRTDRRLLSAPGRP